MLTIKKRWFFFLLFAVAASAIITGCKNREEKPGEKIVPADSSFSFLSLKVNSAFRGFHYFNVNASPVIQLNFSSGIDPDSIDSTVTLKDIGGNSAPFSAFVENDSSLVIQPRSLKPITQYTLNISTSLRSNKDGRLQSAIGLDLITAIDSSDKFPRISDSALVTLVQQQTFKYFYDFGHPVSGLTRERNVSADVVTTGGSGFGVMALLVGVKRNFITRPEGLARVQKIVHFLGTKAKSYHGAFPHWMNGATGVTIPFSQNDNGADLVETSYMMQGLLCARQFFNHPDSAETRLRSDINSLWSAVEWNWFRQNGRKVLYWHWSPTVNFVMNLPIQGWNEAFLTYVLAASAPLDSNQIPKSVYDSGWAINGKMKNGKTYFDVLLPLGPELGGPLFFADYSFHGINPVDLRDNYCTNYFVQNQAQTLINYKYCIANPQNYNGYSYACWGLTASDNSHGYSAHSPTNDQGVITPAAAICSLPYTPFESMNALRFFYFKLGDKIWGHYGFTDAFNLTNIWFANSYLAIDQGSEIIMIENYRSGFLWNLFMSCPEIKTGMKKLGFNSPHLN